MLRDAYRSASDAGYPHLMLSCRAWMGNCYSDLGRMEEMLTHYSVAERLAEALRDTGSLSALRYNVASTQLELGQPEKALSYFASLPRPGFLDLHKLAICHEQLGHREQALAAVQQAEPMASSEMEQRMLALARYRLEHPDYLHDDTYGAQLLDCFQRLRDTYPMGFTRFHLRDSAKVVVLLALAFLLVAVGAGVVQGHPSVSSSLPPVGGVSCKIAFLPH